MRILYVYPHPDDESFGPGPALAAQGRLGHAVFLLTLTRGGATRQRHALGYSIEEMGAVRFREMQEVARVLGLSGMTVLDLPDSGLKELDPREIERAVRNGIESTRPDVVVTYPVHGISGFPDHLVCHAVVKRLFCELRGRAGGPRRLAFHTLSEDEAATSTHFRLNGSRPEEIDCAQPVEEADLEAGRSALDCYVTFQETIRATGVRDMLKSPVLFEIFDERHHPPLTDLFADLPPPAPALELPPLG